MSKEIRILYPGRIYPEISGGSLRTYNMAKLAMHRFSKTTIFARDYKIGHAGKIEGVHIIQKKNGNIIKKYESLKCLLSRELIFNSANETFKNKENAVFQAEGPFFYRQLKKQKISDFIVNEHNVCWELLEFPSPSLKTEVLNELLFEKTKKTEIESIENAAYVFVCSERDKKILMDAVPNLSNKTTVIPNCVDLDRCKYFKNENELYTRKKDKFHILFVGTLTYAPNIDAALTICNCIAPKFDNNVIFQIIGANPPKIEIPKNVRFLGYVDDLMGYIKRSDICIAPIKYGSGTRLKILEYMSMAKPVISTLKGAEGIEYTPNRDIILVDYIEAFPSKIQELLADDDKRRIIGENAYNLIKIRYDWKLYKNTLSDIYGQLF